MKLKLLAALAAAAVLTAPAHAQTTQVNSGSGQRSLSISFFDPLGQTFTATGTELLSFGFQIQTLNGGSANSPITFTLRAGAGFDGAVLTTRQLTPSGVPTTRTPTFIDFGLAGTTLALGQTYTALLSSDSNRYGLIFGPDINLSSGQPLGGDAYLGGRFIATGQNDRVCDTGVCDANFRFTTAAVAAIPEPATWATMIAGFGLVGGAMRRRRAEGVAVA